MCKLEIRGGTLGLVRSIFESDSEAGPCIDRFVPWSSVSWKDMRRFQDVFDGVSARHGDQTLIKAIQIMKGLFELKS